tara:strand:- start:1980 stop:2600 length:621 start_codon:yes stop_codon:yes gene_type:complete
MAFWTEGYGAGTKDPKRKFRFKVSIGSIDNNGCVWWAKTVTKPNFEISESEHTFLTHKFYYPGRVTWGEIEMALVDPVNPSAVANLNAMIRAQGYAIPDEGLTGDNDFETMSKGKGTGALSTVLIQQLDAKGDMIEEWELKNPWIKGVKFGDLDYSSDDLLEVTLTLRYDWATCKIGNAVDGADLASPAIPGQPRPTKDFFDAGDE